MSATKPHVEWKKKQLVSDAMHHQDSNVGITCNIGGAGAELPFSTKSIFMVLVKEPCDEEINELCSLRTKAEDEECIEVSKDLMPPQVHKARYFTKQEMWEVLQEAARHPKVMRKEAHVWKQISSKITMRLNFYEYGSSEQWNCKEQKRVKQKKEGGYAFMGETLYKPNKKSAAKLPSLPAHERRRQALISRHRTTKYTYDRVHA